MLMAFALRAKQRSQAGEARSAASRRRQRRLVGPGSL